MRFICAGTTTHYLEIDEDRNFDQYETRNGGGVYGCWVLIRWFSDSWGGLLMII